MSTFCETTAEVELIVRRGGKRGLFIVEVGSRARAIDLLEYLAAAGCETLPIVMGPLVACAVWVREGVDGLFERVAEHLRDHYALSIWEPGFTASMYRVALQLARDAEAESIPIDRCAVCGAPDPFPTILRVRSAEECWSICCCEECLAEIGATSSHHICHALLRQRDANAPWRRMLLSQPRREGDALHFQARLVPEAYAGRLRAGS